MSTTIWDSGKVAACICATYCDRCEKRDTCVNLCCAPWWSGHPQINLCIECFTDLQLRAAEILLERQVLDRQEGHQG